MPLTYFFKEIEDYKDLCYQDVTPEGAQEKEFEIKAVTQHLIFSTMSIGMNKITKENHEAFHNRILFMEKLNGKILYKHDEEEGKAKFRHTTNEEVKAHIGLSTNASTLTKLQFVKRQMRQFENYYPME